MIPGLLTSALIVATLSTAFAGLFLAGGSGGSDLPWHYIGSVVRFTLLQAVLSTCMSVVLGAAIALALARRCRFRGRDLFIAALNLASVLPAVVAVFGIVAVLGRSGWLGKTAGLIGVDSGGWLYGLPGILVAHLFFNAPLAARVFLASLMAVPGERWRLAAELGMGPGSIFRLIDGPVLWREAAGIGMLIFMLCFTSFAVVLTLGGGPKSATLEVAIYEAVRFDVDFARAGLLAFIQVAICLALAVPVLLASRRPDEDAGAGLAVDRPDREVGPLKVLDAVVLGLATVLVVPPLLAVGLSGLAGLRSVLRADIVQAAVTSLAIALPAAALSVAAALSLAAARRSLGQTQRRVAANLVAITGNVVLAIPPIAISAGLFVVVLAVTDPYSLAIPLIVLLNSLMAIPFAFRQIEPPVVLSAERYGRLAESLGVAGSARFRIVEWPLVRRPLMAALAIAAALSVGDLGVAAFFGSGSIQTLPVLLFERMGSYRMDEAASAALILAMLVLGLFLLAQKWSGEAIAGSR